LRTPIDRYEFPGACVEPMSVVTFMVGVPTDTGASATALAARVAELPALAMQKVVGSSPFIRS